MIVVIGSPIGRLEDRDVVAGGVAARVALAAAGAGSVVQLVGKTGDDAVADTVVLDLARGGVGHVALLRDPARTTPMELVALDAFVPDDDPPRADAEPSQPAVTDPHRGPELEPADVDLGLRYLTDFTVVVLAEPVAQEIVGIVAEAARWGASRMVMVLRSGETVIDGLPADVVVFEAPDDDPDDLFANVVGTFAAGLDQGTDADAAFRASLGSDGWTDTSGG
ncbi:MAG: hypothetical protein H0T59_02380 [Chloroflexi bacterium]|nr:hypothetical protein [Chloroflexota bacterium]